jgi:hypothetical protein
MKAIKIISRLSLILVLALVTNSCKKPPGPGGKATVKGTIYAYDYDNTQQYMVSEGFSAGETVYICYGTDNTVDANVKTSYDGSFELQGFR